MLYTLIIFACVVGQEIHYPDQRPRARIPASFRWPPPPVPHVPTRDFGLRVRFTVAIGDIHSEPAEAFPEFAGFVQCLGGPARPERWRTDSGLARYRRTTKENGYCWEHWPRDRHKPSYECFQMEPACKWYDADGDGDVDMYDFALWTRHISSGGHYGIFKGVPMWKKVQGP